MFVRKIKNRSGSTSVQIISKAGRKYQIVETIGITKEKKTIQKLEIKARSRIKELKKQENLFETEKDQSIENFIESLSNNQIRKVGKELVLEKIFNAIGFNSIQEEIFRDLVLARIIEPGSKLKTIKYLKRYEGIEYTSDEVYRFLDKLRNCYQDRIERLVFKYSKKRLKDNISVTFYDMTTLYFEAEEEDDLRKIGFSKDGKFQNPQIMLGLLVGKNGYPLGWDVFEGNSFEGHTLIPTIEKFQKKFNLKKPIIVADSGLLSSKNIEHLEEKKFKYILGARIKNLKESDKEKVLDLNLKDGQIGEIELESKRLLITYSDKRACKDKRNREKGLARLEKRVKSGKLTKESINNRGYNKYLVLDGAVKVEIDYDKFKKDEKWDGLKGYITNSNKRYDILLDHYKDLWQIERAFRISKSDLRIRPIFHRLKDRILSHICISFCAYTVVKELERILKKHHYPHSAKHTCDLIQNIYEINCVLPDSLKKSKILLQMDNDQKYLVDIIRSEFG